MLQVIQAHLAKAFQGLPLVLLHTFQIFWLEAGLWRSMIW